jgi:hypothetical protein
MMMMTEIEVPDDYVEPRITVWPECEQCHTTYVYRRGFRFTEGGWEWLWQADCRTAKCRRESTPVLVKGDTT